MLIKHIQTNLKFNNKENKEILLLLGRMKIDKRTNFSLNYLIILRIPRSCLYFEQNLENIFFFLLEVNVFYNFNFKYISVFEMYI